MGILERLLPLPVSSLREIKRQVNSANKEEEQSE
jgi:hypothetical protein